ncbi:alpha/beta hydrolase family protein [Acidicapsa acidisoli]|uniref:alpha/beta hydrolase family protein n=1 Tax=Acidicapsa acidisoli TaxID=1615681 RepID=UPI0021DFC4ED|nr:hypothetical protein [Acidicapsa acidisoli]
MKSLVYWAATGMAVLAPTHVFSQEHLFSVKDDIAMRRFSDPHPEHGIPGSEIARKSPDGRYVVVVTTKGLLASDQIESDISVFDVEQVAAFLKTDSVHAPSPRLIAKIVSFPHRAPVEEYAPVIQDLSWSPDKTSVYFKGESPTGAYQLYEARLDGSGFQTLTPANISVNRFDVVKETIVYSASRAGVGRTPHGDIINTDAQRLTGYSLEDVLFPGEMNSLAPETFTLSVLHRAHGRWVTNHLPQYSLQEIPTMSHLFPFAVSPRADQLIALTPVSSIPVAWKGYDPASGYENLRMNGNVPGRTSVDNLLRPERYSLINLMNGRSIALFDAPNARILGYYDRNRLAWAADGKRVLLTNTFLSADTVSAQSNTPCAVASVDLPSLQTSCLFFEDKGQQPSDKHVLDVSFGTDDNEALVLLRNGPNEQIFQRYRRENGHWYLLSSSHFNAITNRLHELASPEKLEHEELQVSVRQGYNDPPMLWASNLTTGKLRQLWDPNPQFTHIRFGEAASYNWKDSTGREWNGVLVKPVGYMSGQRYPMVLQMYSFTEDEFVTDGVAPSAFAARHLASAGFVVLQIKKKPSTLSEADPQTHLEGYRSAIETLDKAGLIDPSRVGVVGFSWTCWYVVNALIKDPKLFAAATIADGLDNSYMQYILFDGDIQRQMDTIRGTSPFGNGLKRWVEEAPGFNLDKVETPVRIEAINPLSVLQEWELYTSLRLQHKSVDLIYFPEGTHIHQKPLERLESQQGNVDWLRFWLQGYEDPDPAKHDQYEVWRHLKNTHADSSGIQISK